MFRLCVCKQRKLVWHRDMPWTVSFIFQDQYWRALIDYCVKEGAYTGCDLPPVSVTLWWQVHWQTNLLPSSIGLLSRKSQFRKPKCRKNCLGFGTLLRVIISEWTRFHSRMDICSFVWITTDYEQSGGILTEWINNLSWKKRSHVWSFVNPDCRRRLKLDPVPHMSLAVDG